MLGRITLSRRVSETQGLVYFVSLRIFAYGDGTVTLTIIPVFAAVFAVFFVLLSVNVIRARRLHKVGIGTGRNKAVERAMRVHANFAEYAPFSLLLIALLEINKASDWLLIGLCWVLLVGRLVHAYGVSMENERFIFRVSGMVMTFTVILGAALANLAAVILSAAR